MPAQTQSNADLLKTLGARAAAAHAKHAADDTSYGGFANLPAGIMGGRARLTAVKVGKYAKGKDKDQPFVGFSATVLAPEQFKGVQCGRKQFTLTFPLCDQPHKTPPVSFDENYAELLNEVRKFGYVTKGTTFADLDKIFAAMTVKKPVFEFSTRGWTPAATAAAPNPTEMVFITNEGIAEAPVVKAGAGIADSTAAQPSANGDGHEPPDSQDIAEASNDDRLSDENLDALVAACEQGDGSAIAEITKIATELGCTEQEVENANPWSAVKELIQAKIVEGNSTPDEGPVSGEPDKPFEPVLKQVYDYQIKKGGKVYKAVCIKINKKDQQVDLVNEADKNQKWTGIAWDKIAASPY